MDKIKKIRIIFSFYFEQVYLLITSFLTGNVWARPTGSYEDIDIHPTVRFGNYPENIFFKKYFSWVWYTYICRK